MTEPTHQIVHRLITLSRAHPLVLVAVDGQGGAGKSTLAESLSSALTSRVVPVEVIHFEDFYLPSTLRTTSEAADNPTGGDFDWARCRDEVLGPLRSGQRANYRRHDWKGDELTENREVLPAGVVIVEGMYSTRSELRSFYDLRIWVDCSRDIRLERGIVRHGEQSRGHLEEDWMPAEDRYVAVHQPREHAHFIFDGAGVA